MIDTRTLAVIQYLTLYFHFLVLMRLFSYAPLFDTSLRRSPRVFVLVLVLFSFGVANVEVSDTDFSFSFLVLFSFGVANVEISGTDFSFSSFLFFFCLLVPPSSFVAAVAPFSVAVASTCASSAASTCVGANVLVGNHVVGTNVTVGRNVVG